MIGRIVLVVLVVAVLGVGVLFLSGQWNGSAFGTAPDMTGFRTPRIETQAVRRQGAELGEKAAVVAARAGDTLEEVGLTAKITAKMVLDDLVKARAINVTTTGTTVTLTGTVHSEQERARAVALATETEGVTRVVDHLILRPI